MTNEILFKCEIGYRLCAFLRQRKTTTMKKKSCKIELKLFTVRFFQFL